MMRSLTSLPSGVTIVRDSACQQDEGQPSSLLEQTWGEQFGEVHTAAHSSQMLFLRPVCGVRCSVLWAAKSAAKVGRPRWRTRSNGPERLRACRLSLFPEFASRVETWTTLSEIRERGSALMIGP